MRKLFAQKLFEAMKNNEKIWLLTGDLGYGLWDEIKLKFPARYINVGAAEQALLDIGVGLALEGKIPFVYSITSFLLYRPFEAIRNYLHYEKIPVKLIGSGRDKDYGGLGLTHWAYDDKVVMAFFNNIKSYWPEKEEIPTLLREVINNKKPCYINLKK